jgi:hypothetical protein
VVGPLHDGSSMPASEKVALNVTPPTMSVPTLSQSGSSSAFLIHSCRSGENGVPGAMIGFWGREPEKMLIGIGKHDLRDEEIVIGV